MTKNKTDQVDIEEGDMVRLGETPSQAQQRRDAKRAGENELRQKRLGEKAAHRAWALGYPRETPLQERVAKSGGYRSADGITVRLSDALPGAVIRMRRKGSLTAKQCRAAEIFIADHDMGYGSGVGTTNFQERVQGGGFRSDEVAADVVDARRRYEAAAAVMPEVVAEVVRGVLLNGAELTSVGDYASRHSRVETRRTCAATILGLGLHVLAQHYGLTDAHKAK